MRQLEIAADAAGLTNIVDIIIGVVVVRRRCPTADDFLDRRAAMLHEIAFQQEPGGTIAVLHLLKLAEGLVREVFGLLPPPCGGLCAANVQRVVVADAAGNPCGL